MRPDEVEAVETQDQEFRNAVQPILQSAAQSTVRIWTQSRRGRTLAVSYGVVIGDGRQVLTKWSEVSASRDQLWVEGPNQQAFSAQVEGVYTDDDLVLLRLGDVNSEAFQETRKRLPAIRFEPIDLIIGKFLFAPQPSGSLAGFGVTAVLERNLRETDRAHLGIEVDRSFQGKGVKVASVEEGFGAADAGVEPGDIILQVGDREITGLFELKNALSGTFPGEELSLVIDTAGREREVTVVLSNRPSFGSLPEQRLSQMEKMGGSVNRVREGFSKVVQTDMQIESHQMGGPVVDLQGRVVGINVARADRTRTYLIGSGALLEILATEPDTPEEALAKRQEAVERIAQERRQLRSRQQQGERPLDLGDIRRHAEDSRRLSDFLSDEMSLLQQP